MNLYSIDGHSIPAPNRIKAVVEFRKKYHRDPIQQPILVAGREPELSFENVLEGLFGNRS